MTVVLRRCDAGIAGIIAFALVLVGGCGYATNTGPKFRAPVRPPVIAASKVPAFNTPVLTDRGFMLYVFQPDHRSKSTCYGPCAQIWPPLTVGTGQQAGAGTGVGASLLGSDPYSGRTRVVTYNGWPLYRYRNDTIEGAAAGQALDLNGGYWYVIGADGKPIVPPGDPPAS